MKLNISYPANGTNKLIDIDEESRYRVFYERRMGQEIEGDLIGDEFKGYVFKITGGNDKQGFPMKQGVLQPTRVRLLLSKGHSCYRERRDGERRRKSVRGCIIGPDMAVLSLAVVKQGDAEIEGLTDNSVARRLGPKRANHIRKFFGLTKEDDPRQYVNVFRREVTGKNGRTYTKAPRIQRLITPRRLQHKRRLRAQKLAGVLKSKDEAADYAQLLAKRVSEKKAEKAEIKKRRASSLRAQA